MVGGLSLIAYHPTKTAMNPIHDLLAQIPSEYPYHEW